MQRRGVIGHVLPESKDVDIRFFQHLREHLDEELRIRIQHLFHKGRIVIEERAEALDAHQIAQGAKAPAPAVGDDHKGEIPVAQGPQALAPIRTDPLTQIGLHPLAPILAKVLARVDGITNELRHGAQGIALE